MGDVEYSQVVGRQFANASEATKRAVALAACKLAASRLIPDDPLVQSALRALEAGNYTDAELTKKLARFGVSERKAERGGKE